MICSFHHLPENGMLCSPFPCFIFNIFAWEHFLKKPQNKTKKTQLSSSLHLRATGDIDLYSKGSQAINTSLRKQTYCVVGWQTRLIVKIIWRLCTRVKITWHVKTQLSIISVSPLHFLHSAFLVLDVLVSVFNAQISISPFSFPC